MKYASKINLPVDIKNIISVGAKIATYVDKFDLYKAKNYEEIISYLPETIRNKKTGFYIVNVDFGKGSPEIRAHKHTKEKCVLNVYLKTNGEETIFYEGQEVILDPTEGRSVRPFYNLSHDTLQKVESFIAQENECWLLNTDQPHSIIAGKELGIRSFIQIYFLENTYDEIINLLK